jgi:hypothetical protein
MVLSVEIEVGGVRHRDLAAVGPRVAEVL